MALWQSQSEWEELRAVSWHCNPSAALGSQYPYRSATSLSRYGYRRLYLRALLWSETPALSMSWLQACSLKAKGPSVPEHGLGGN